MDRIRARTATHLLTTGVLELRTTKGLDDLGLVTVAGAHRHDWLADADTGNGSLGLTEGTSHSSLESARNYNAITIRRRFQSFFGTLGLIWCQYVSTCKRVIIELLIITQSSEKAYHHGKTGVRIEYINKESIY